MSARRVDVGTPLKNFRGWTITEVNFHGFTGISTARGVPVASPEFSCFGHQWVLQLYPGGEEDSEVGYAAVVLSNRSNKSSKVQWGCSVRDADGKVLVHDKSYTNDFAAVSEGVNAWSSENFALRLELLEY